MVETCTDGIQNQKERGIDCGGPCSACSTCDDEIKNQNESCWILLISEDYIYAKLYWDGIMILVLILLATSNATMILIDATCLFDT